MVADTKKAQTVINAAAAEITAMREGMDRIVALRDLFVAQAVDPTGTPLEGNTAALTAALTDLNAALNQGASGTVFDALIAGAVPSHEGKAL